MMREKVSDVIIQRLIVEQDETVGPTNSLLTTYSCLFEGFQLNQHKVLCVRAVKGESPNLWQNTVGLFILFLQVQLNKLECHSKIYSSLKFK